MIELALLPLPDTPPDIVLDGETAAEVRTPPAADRIPLTLVTPMGGDAKTLVTLATPTVVADFGTFEPGGPIPKVTGNAPFIVPLAIITSLIAAVGKLVVTGIVEAMTE